MMPKVEKIVSLHSKIVSIWLRRLRKPMLRAFWIGLR